MKQYTMMASNGSVVPHVMRDGDWVSHDAATILQHLYDSEINFLVSSPCWDGGFSVALKPDPYGDNWEIKVDGIETYWDAVSTLADLVCEHYPRSKFCEWWNRPEVKDTMTL